jgi:hypothetical protein
VLVWLSLVLLMLVGGEIGEAREAGSEIRGSVMALGDRPVANAYVQVRVQERQTSGPFATTAADGSYRVGDLQPGIYSLTISANGFHSTEIRDVQIDRAAVKMMPTVRLEFGMFDCGSVLRLDHYRLLAGAAETGAVGGTVMNDRGGLIAGATVTLYVQGGGPISTNKTRDDGTFSFLGVQVHSEEYFVSIAREGYFSEELHHLTVLPGLEAVYVPITMEPCSPGRCQSYLKTIRVIPGCA